MTRVRNCWHVVAKRKIPKFRSFLTGLGVNEVGGSILINRIRFCLGAFSGLLVVSRHMAYGY